MVKERNDNIDIFRGIAILLVVAGHTLAKSSVNSENTMILNIIWTLQMPLFMLISGYVTKYSKKIDDKTKLWKYISKRTSSYLVPWAIWIFFVRGIILGDSRFLNLKWTLWNMDSGYWFLTSLWTICMIFGVSQFLAIKMNKGKSQLQETIKTLIFCSIGSIPLLIVGKLMGIYFWGIKLTLYYLPFFLAGYLFTNMQNNFKGEKWFKTAKEVSIAVSVMIYCILLSRFNFYTIDDSLFNIILRIIASMSGCISLFGLGNAVIKNFNSKYIKQSNMDIKSKVENQEKNVGGNRIWKFLAWTGRYSLEIYIIHELLLNIIHLEIQLEVIMLGGFVLVVVNYLITLIICITLILLLEQNKICKKLLFGK